MTDKAHSLLTFFKKSLCKLLGNLALIFGIGWYGAAAWSEEIVIPGSGNPEYVLRALAEAFGRAQTQHRVVIPTSSGTAGALRDVENGKAVLGRVGRPLKADEIAKGLTYISLGRDPVAFVGGAGVSVKGLTTAQVVDIYTGKVTNWKELGGKPGPIRAIGREPTDTSRQAINRGIKAFETITFGEGVKQVNLDPQMIELLDRYPTSIGFLNRSALPSCKTKVVAFALDGVEPSPLNVGAGHYKISIEVGLIHKTGSLNPAASAFLAFVRSSTAIGILREHGILAAAGSV